MVATTQEPHGHALNEGSPSITQALLRGYTSVRRPVVLAYSQHFERIEDAIQAERQIKGWSRAKKEALIRGDFDELRALAKRQGTAQSSTLLPHGSRRPPHHEAEQFQPSGVDLMVNLSNHEPCGRALFRHLIVAHGDFEQEALGARLVYELGESACLLASRAPILGIWLKLRRG
jgi:hypothetical protein